MIMHMLISYLNKEQNPLLSAAKDGILEALHGKPSIKPATTEPAPEVDPSLVSQDIPSSID